MNDTTTTPQNEAQPSPESGCSVVFFAVDKCQILGQHASLMFRHRPYLTDHGIWYCRETDDPLGGRHVVPNLMLLEPGQIVQATITPNTPNEGQP